MPAIELGNRGENVPVLQVRNLSDRHARANAVAHLVARHRHAPHEIALLVLPHVHIAIAARLHHQRLDILARHRGLNFRFPQRRLLRVDRRRIRRLPVVQILPELVCPVLRGRQRQVVLARRNRGQNRILADIAFGNPHVRLRLFERIARLLRIRFRLRLRLFHLQLAFGDVGFRFFQFVFLVRRIQFQNCLAGLHHLAGPLQAGDVHLAAPGQRSRQHLRIAAMQFAPR